MQRNSILLISSLTLFVSFFAVAEGKKLSADEVKALFIGKTCDGYNPIKDKDYKLFTQDDSSVLHQNPKRTKERPWKVTDDGQHCVKFKKFRCGTIHDMGEGVYHKMRDGEHINTLKNFREGNDL